MNNNIKNNINNQIEDISLKNIQLYKNPDNNWKTEKINGRIVEIPMDWGVFDNYLLFKKNKKSIYSPKEALSNGTIPLFNCSEKQTLFMNNYISNKESILLSTGGLPSIHYINEKHSYTTDVLSIDILDINSKYYYYYFKTNIKLLEISFQGSGLKHLSKTLFEKLKLYLPTIREQKKIVSILTKQETLIEEKQEYLRKYIKQRTYFQQELLSGRLRIKLTKEAQSIALKIGYITQDFIVLDDKEIKIFEIVENKKEDFEKWINEDFYKKIEFYKNPDNNWKNEKINGRILEIPMDWIVKKIGDIAIFFPGFAFKENEVTDKKTLYKLLKIGNIDFEGQYKYISNNQLYLKNPNNRFILNSGDIILAMDDLTPTAEFIGTTVIVKEKNTFLNQRIGTFKNLKSNNYFFHYLINQNQKFFKQIATGSTAKNLSKKSIENLKLPLPTTKTEQTLISTQLTKLDNIIDKLEEEIKKEEKQFTYLKQELLSGRLRIK